MRSSSPRHDDPGAGFTLIETTVSIAVAGIVLTALTSFFITTTRLTNRQNGTLTAIEVATSAADETRSVRGANLPRLGQPSAITVNGVTYRPTRTITACWLPATGTMCAASTSSTATPMYRVAITVTWNDRACPAGTCTYSSTTLISNNADPQFNANQ